MLQKPCSTGQQYSTGLQTYNMMYLMLHWLICEWKNKSVCSYTIQHRLSVAGIQKMHPEVQVLFHFTLNTQLVHIFSVTKLVVVLSVGPILHTCD